MKKNKIGAALVPIVATVTGVGLAISLISVASTNTNSASLAENTSLASSEETSAVCVGQESSYKYTKAKNAKCTPSIEKNEKNISLDEYLEDIDSEINRLKALEADPTRDHGLDKKTIASYEQDKKYGKDDMRACEVMKKYDNSFKYDCIIKNYYDNIDCMRSMVEVLKKNDLADDEANLLKNFIERHRNILCYGGDSEIYDELTLAIGLPY